MYLIIAALLAIIGFYFYLNMKQSNDVIAKLKESGTIASVPMKKLDGTIYQDDRDDIPYYWGYDLPYTDANHTNHNHTQKYNGKDFDPLTMCDAATMNTYTMADYREMGGMIDIYYSIDEDGNYITYDKIYVDYYKPISYLESGFLWSLAGISFALALYYLIRNIVYLVVASKGVGCIGRFEEAFHTKFGSSKYYKVRYTYTFNGQEFTGVSPAVYTGMDVDKLKAYGTMMVKLMGKITVLDQKL